ncbi:hypothetical protein [Dickeya poaceiphila]|uniref:Uncharacterized protein n=1 Tax=Dickeya poaceiphila TaxID=568768 RepID=A0A5B8I3L8_9GAMM|nr:hypothetical protein [Dickeya poaceiphila]QDX29233.1 hypothetical protein Dpoa569_0000966 [Dickeya poaceiphila]
MRMIFFLSPLILLPQAKADYRTDIFSSGHIILIDAAAGSNGGLGQNGSPGANGGPGGNGGDGGD